MDQKIGSWEKKDRPTKKTVSPVNLAKPTKTFLFVGGGGESLKTPPDHSLAFPENRGMWNQSCPNPRCLRLGVVSRFV